MAYRVDGDRVFYSLGVRHEQLCEADPATFRALGEEYGKDGQRVYFQGAPVEHADSSSFEAISRFHGRDAHRVFWRGRVVELASPTSFRALGGDYGRDGDVVFDCNRVLEGADAATFEVLDEAHARDSARVYRYGEVVPDVPPHDVEVWGPYARIGTTCSYLGHDLAGADGATFRGLDGGDYALDGRRAYHAGAPMRGVKVASFVVRGRAIASDDMHSFVGGAKYDGPLEEGWASLDLRTLEPLVVTGRHGKAAARGDAKAMQSLARDQLMNGDAFDAMVWARLAEIFGGKRLARVETDGWLMLDPHEEIPELVADISRAAAQKLWDGACVPRSPQHAEEQLGRALREGLLELVNLTRESLVNDFGAECVAAAEAIAKLPARKGSRSKKPVR